MTLRLDGSCYSLSFSWRHLQSHDWSTVIKASIVMTADLVFVSAQKWNSHQSNWNQCRYLEAWKVWVAFVSSLMAECSQDSPFSAFSKSHASDHKTLRDSYEVLEVDGTFSFENCAEYGSSSECWLSIWCSLDQIFRKSPTWHRVNLRFHLRYWRLDLQYDLVAHRSWGQSPSLICFKQWVCPDSVWIPGVHSCLSTGQLSGWYSID